VLTLPPSDALFCGAFPRECTEAFREGHRRVFDFFGGVPRRLSSGNSKIAVAKITGRRPRELTKEYLQLRSHCLFEAPFGRVRQANAKGPVANLVGYARSNFLVPVPAVPSSEARNADREAKCRQDLQQRLRGKAACKAELLAQERTELL